MSLLTKEQQDDVNTIKNYVLSSLPVHNDQSHDYRMLRHMCMRLIPIIDDLHARAPRQYTEQELREAFESYNFHPSFLRFDNFKQWVHCARALGALNAEP